LRVRLASATAENERSFGFLPDHDRRGPVVIAEKSGNPGGGEPGDTTHVLQELIKYNAKQACGSVPDQMLIQFIP
jgi:microcystin degradation protein MlrC